MPDPLQIERLFQELTDLLEINNSIRYQHKKIFYFLEKIGRDYTKYESYLRQIVEDFPTYEKPLQWTGLDPQIIERYIDRLDEISCGSSNAVADEIHKIIIKLRGTSVLLYACLDNTERVKHYLNLIFNKPLPLSEENKDLKKPGAFLFRALRSLLIDVTLDKPLIEECKKYIIQQIEAIGSMTNGAMIPVVESHDWKEGKTLFGRIRFLELEIFGKTDQEHDLIQNFLSIGGKDKMKVTIEKCKEAGYSLYQKNYKNGKRPNLKGGLSFAHETILHEGNSANLAIASLWYAALTKEDSTREYYTVNPNIAITGDISVAGEVLPVDLNSVTTKAQAVFFSWAKLLVVPLAQRSNFEEAIGKLQEKYPERRIELLGINDLKDLFSDRRIAVYMVQGRFTYMMNRLKNEHSKYILIPLIIVLLLIVARLVYGPIDKNSVIIEYEGSDIVLKNSSESTIDRLEVGETTVNYQNTGSNQEQYPLAALNDFDEDGKNELIFINRVEQSKLETPSLKAWSVTGDSLIWERHITFNYKYPRQSAFMNLGLRASELRLLETNNGPKIILNAGLIQYFQSVIFTIDALSGKIEQEYVHPGRLNDVMVYDIDEDQVDELIFTGINNAYWNAMIGVLEYGEAQGYGPATIDYIPTGLKRANEQIYLLLPKSVVGKYFDSVWKYNMGRRIHYDLLSENFYFTVVEGTRRFTEFEDEIELIFYFDSDMKPIGIGTNDLYDITARNLYQQGEIKLEPDFEYFESLQDSILYRQGEQFLRTDEYDINN